MVPQSSVEYRIGINIWTCVWRFKGQLLKSYTDKIKIFFLGVLTADIRKHPERKGKQQIFKEWTEQLAQLPLKKPRQLNRKQIVPST